MKHDNKLFLITSAIFLIILTIVACEARAATADGIGFSFLCKTENTVRLRVSLPDDVLLATAYAGNYAAAPTIYLRWLGWELEPVIALQIPRVSDYLGVHSQIDRETFDYQVDVPQSLPNCSDFHDAHPQNVPGGNECLGLVYPGAGEFTVDGNSYNYYEYLSFIVPVDAVWEWRLFIEGELILVFSQTEDQACHVTEDYRGN